MVNQKHFSQLFPGKPYKASSFDTDAYNDFSVLPLSKQGAKASLERMALKLLQKYKPDLDQLLTLDNYQVPEIPQGQTGWYPSQPSAAVLVFDIETMVKLGGKPVYATALSSDGQVYYWVTPEYGCLIDLPDNTLVIGHNVTFDAQGIASSFSGLDHGCLFMDTMTLANMCYGFCSQQYWAVNSDKPKPIWAYKGYGSSNYKSLAATYEWLYPDMPLVDKEIRNIFVESDSLSEVLGNTAELLDYNLEDVRLTHQVFKKLFPYWQQKNPSPITLYGHILSTSYKLPLTPGWQDWITEVDSKYELVSQEIGATLLSIADKWVAQGYSASNPYHQHLDWTVSQRAKKYKGLPNWYRKEMMSKGTISLRSRVAHYLLALEFDGEPVFYSGGYRTVSTKIPHPSGSGNVGYLFSKDLLPLYENGMLKSSNPECQDLLDKAISLTYWTSVQSRVKSAVVINNWTLPQTGGGTVTGRVTDPLWLTTCDPKKHLIGSELKSRIQAPPGYKLLIADFSSQEMRIAWTLGDSINGYMGSCEMSRSGVVGDKASGTDAHSTLAAKLSQLTGQPYSRQDAKIAGFSMLYMAGQKAVASYIRQVIPSLSIDKAKAIAKDALEYRRGKTVYTQEGRYYSGGTDSDAYNAIDRIANQPRPRTPLLQREMTDPLCPQYVKDDFYTTRANWVVQGSARDQLDTLSVALTFMINHANLKSRLIWSRHDEVIVMCPDSEVELTSELLQQSHTFTWAAFHECLNLYDLPTPGLLFDSIDVDVTVRKDPTKPIVTPSMPHSDVPDGYSIPSTSFKGFSDWNQLLLTHQLK
jgi:DNA polymerase gamma 1